jgi:hypothetical protein
MGREEVAPHIVDSMESSIQSGRMINTKPENKIIFAVLAVQLLV